jgi:adenylyltransferase/sulfurtransferase
MPAITESAALPELTTDDLSRYSRHLILPEVGMEGQRRLKAARVLCVGTGGLGSPLALYLTAAGIGTLGLVDFDVVDSSNLQRQIIHSTKDIGRKKIDSAEEKLSALNPAINIVKHETMLNSSNALEIMKDYDIVADGTDNFPTRYLVNDASLLKRIPVVHGSIFRFEGQVTVFNPYVGPCYRCLLPEPPPPELAPSCSEAGVLGVLPGIVGSLQAVEAIKLLLGIGETLQGRLLAYDALEESFRTFKVRRDPQCPACGEDAGDIVIAEYDELCMPHAIAPAGA